MFTGNAIVKGTLMHRRYRPLRHELRYHVADVLVDVDDLANLNDGMRLIGYNRRRLFSIDDRNHGPGDGTPIAAHVRGLMQQLQLAAPVKRIFMLCYPAVLGRVFNPLTTYFGLDEDGRWVAVVYEVNNTFGQRHAYVLPVEGASHRAEKCFFVSPFNPVQGEYRFSFEHQGKGLRLNIALFEEARLKLTARFEGQEQPLNDRALLASALSLALQPLKILGAIHWQAVKLYFKGLRPNVRPAHARFAATATLSSFEIHATGK
jgi:DUF1365 family protein